MISLEQAIRALTVSEKKARELGTLITTVIVDTHGSIIAVARMDGALPISPKFAYSKAFTSANLGMASGDIAAFAGEGKPYVGLTQLFGGELTTIAGGIPVKKGGKVIGAVGVGGSVDVAQDAQCALAAQKTLEE